MDTNSSYTILRKFLAPEIIFGNGARHLVGQYCNNFNVNKILVVTDSGVIKAGWLKDITASLDKQGLKYVVYSEISPNPRDFEVMKGTDVYLSNNCDSIVAVGGGSPMDCAKGIGIVAINRGHILDYEGINKIDMPLPPLIFIPTTAGTSADVSQFCIINNVQELVKIAIVSKIVIPDIALIDPETTITMDPYLTACTGMDALSHAFEAFVSTASSEITDIHALKAIQLLNEYLPQITQNYNDIDIRNKIMLASMEAGLAFSNAVLGAVHAMAHSLGGFLDLPHGECNSLLLEHVVNFNFDAASEKYTVLAENMGVSTKGMTSSQIQKNLFERVSAIRRAVGINKNLSITGVKSADIPLLAGKALNDACIITNPRKADKRDIEVIYEEAM